MGVGFWGEFNFEVSEETKNAINSTYNLDRHLVRLRQRVAKVVVKMSILQRQNAGL